VFQVVAAGEKVIALSLNLPPGAKYVTDCSFGDWMK
jgi:hypothetical protein